MITVYIDVYFLINFTVDLLAFHLATAFVRVRTGNVRLFLASFVSAVYACVVLFINANALVVIALSIAMLPVISCILVSRISFLRRFKLMTAFLLFLTVIGGAVYFAFDFLTAYFPEQTVTAIENRKLLVLSILVLLVIGIIRLLLVLFFCTATEKCAHVKLVLLGKVLECDALVDSGNLLRDPIDLSPVMMIKADAVSKLFPNGLPSIDDFDESVERFVRLIPVNKSGNTTVVLGIRPEKTFVLKNKDCVETKLTFIIDEEEGRYGGYEALLPASALESI